MATLYTSTAVLAFSGILFTIKSFRLKNKSIIVLLSCILFYSVNYWVYNYLGLHSGANPTGALLSGSEALCHWGITYTYIKVEF